MLRNPGPECRFYFLLADGWVIPVKLLLCQSLGPFWCKSLRFGLIINLNLPVNYFTNTRFITQNNINTDTSRETLAKLRICILHFSEDMIKPYGQKRYLRDHAIPMLHIPNTAADGASTSSTEIGTVAVVESSENAGGNSNFPTTCGTEHQITITTVPAVDVANLRRKIRRQKKLLYKRKNIINLHRQQKKKKKKTHRSDTWEEATTDLPQTQKLVLDMMYRNFHHASQVFTQVLCMLMIYEKEYSFIYSFL
ncbi:uncharacterized protein LOC113563032 [Ooceraea biroi]|uniref:uncharacterized protein LOC113563032 n=1 Tax=Ooceraea biroi TaxID=2015173 RepID=UPI000F077892|nr:uncharacterized protein LOC113563032 [Ooceraea biroi]